MYNNILIMMSKILCLNLYIEEKYKEITIDLKFTGHQVITVNLYFQIHN